MNKAVMYLRLSREDEESKESNSIKSQREIIKAYSIANNIEIIKEFVDDGFSGSNFNRPSFQKMIKEIENNTFNTIIVKDLSRFGRDYIESGKYLQKIFPQKNIRFISVNDNYDSENANITDTHLLLPIKNFINDSYCRDISIKVKSSKDIKRKKGEYISSFAPFGYKKDLKNKYRLVVDEEVSHIVKRIFEMKIEGYSSKKIADILNNLGTITPSKYKEEINGACNGFTSNTSNWHAKMVNRIITNKIYIGTLEQGKTSKLNYKSSRIINLNKEDWIVKEDAHDKIVSKSIFLLANKMLLRDIRNLGVPDLLSGMLFCYECNSSLSKRTVKNKNGRENITYSCSNHKKNKTCSSHTISEEKILKAIVFVMNNYSKKYNELIKKLSEINISDFNIEIHTAFLQKEKKKFEHLRHSLYFDLEDELISKKEFENYRQYYLNKIRDIDNKIANKHSLYQKLKENFNTGNFKKFIQKVNEENLDRFTLVSFVDKVLIKENGEIEVVLNNYDTLDILEKLATSIENKTQNKEESFNITSFRNIINNVINDNVCLGGSNNG